MSDVAPEGWSCYEFSELADLVKGVTYKSSDYTDVEHGLPFITIKCISKGGGFSYRGLKYYKGAFKESQVLNVGDIVFSNTDLTRNGDIVGSPLKLPDIANKNIALFSMDLSKVNVRTDKVNSNYFYYWLMQSNIKQLMINYSAGSTVLHLNTNSVKKIKGVIAPLPEQKKIASILSSVDEVINKTEAQINKLQDLKKGMMQELLTKGIGHTEFKDSPVGRIPKSWDVRQFDSVLNIEMESSILDDLENYSPVVVRRRHLGVETREIKLGKKILVKKQHRVIPNTFLISKRQIIHGSCGIIPEGISELAIISKEYLQLSATGELDIHYFNYYSYLRQFHETIKKTTYGIDIEKYVFKEQWWFKEVFSLPPLLEQQEIASILASVDSNLDHKQHNLNQIQSLKKALMQDLLTGKVRVNLKEDCTKAPKTGGVYS